MDQTALPMQVTWFDFEDKNSLSKDWFLEEEKHLQWTTMQQVVEADGTEGSDCTFRCSISKMRLSGAN